MIDYGEEKDIRKGGRKVGPFMFDNVHIHGRKHYGSEKNHLRLWS